MRKISLYTAIFSMLLALTLFSKKVNAEGTHSNVTGTLVAPQSSQESRGNKNKDGNKDLLPNTGEKEKLNLVGLGILCFSFGGMIIYYKNKRYNKEKKILLFVATLTLILSNSPPVFANTFSSTVTGEIIQGDLSMTTPNNLTFSATLTGRNQELALHSIKTTVSDYRGVSEDWELTVESSNFDKYFKNYQLNINGHDISASESLVFVDDKNELIKEVILPVKANISAKAQTGSYSANLEWNLQPNIKKLITE